MFKFRRLSVSVFLFALTFGVKCWLQDNRKKCCSSIDAFSQTPDCNKQHACKGDYCVNWEINIHHHPLYIFGCMRRLPFGIPAGESDGKPKCNTNKQCSCQNSGGDQFLNQFCNRVDLTNNSPKWPDIPCPGCQHGSFAQDRCGRGPKEPEFCQVKDHPCLWHGPLEHNSTSFNVSDIWMDCQPKIDLMNDLGVYVSPASWPDGTSVCFSRRPLEENTQDCMCKGSKVGECFTSESGTWMPPPYPASQPVVKCYDGFGNNRTCWGHFCVQTWQTKGCLNFTNPAVFGLPTKRVNPMCIEVRGKDSHPLWTSCTCNSMDYCTERCCMEYAPPPVMTTTTTTQTTSTKSADSSSTSTSTSTSTHLTTSVTRAQGGGVWRVSSNKLLIAILLPGLFFRGTTGT